MPTRKDLKEAYKQQKSAMGVFVIRNMHNNKSLIDYSMDMPAKWNRHRSELKFGSHRNKELQQDWNAHGEELFAFEVLSELKESQEVSVNYKKELKTLLEMVVAEYPRLDRYN